MRKAHNFLDITGEVFGRLTVVGRATFGKDTKWHCRCQCGAETTVLGTNLRRGLTTSCGCWRVEVGRKLAERRNSPRINVTPARRSWRAMVLRCHYPSSPDYPNYGGRGIAVCDRWRNSFDAFLADMGERPPETSIERINVNGDYEPANCRWATAADQAKNTRATRRLGVDGDLRCLSDWAQVTGIALSTLRKRLSKGMSPKEAIFSPVNKIKATKSRGLQKTS